MNIPTTGFAPGNFILSDALDLFLNFEKLMISKDTFFAGMGSIKMVGDCVGKISWVASIGDQGVVPMAGMVLLNFNDTLLFIYSYRRNTYAYR